MRRNRRSGRFTPERSKTPADPADAFARYRELVDDWSAFLDALRRPLPVCVWTNTLRETPERLAARLRADGVEVSPLAWNDTAFRLPPGTKPGKLWPLLCGLYHIQEEVSMLPVALLDPRPGERVLDLCACPGNKTAQIAVAMRNGGTVVANDVQFGRMRAMRNTLERLGLFCVSTTVWDGRNYPSGAGEFDRVLVDAPCSCEGTSRKNDGVTEELAAGGYRHNVPIQKGILRRAIRLCRPGGRVVYSTCTYAPEENEEVIDWALGELGDDKLRVVPAHIDGLTASSGLIRWNGRNLHPDVAGTLRVWPHQNDTGGFFVAVLEKLAPDRHVPRTPAEPGAPRVRVGHDAEIDLTTALAFVRERFGIDEATFEDLEIFHGSRQGFYGIARDHRIPKAPEPDASGVFLFKTSMAQPKLSTAGVMAFGDRATRNRLSLDAEQRDQYFLRRSIELRQEQLRDVSGRGPVIVTYDDTPLGIGFFRPRDDGGEGGELESFFPKGWAWGLGGP